MKKILILSANPTNTNRLRLDEEVREIQAALERARRRDQFEVITRWAVRPNDLRRALLDCNPQIVHFSGHGAGAQGLALEDDSGAIQLVSSQALTQLFKLCKGTIECVLLNACYSQEQAETILQHIDCVIGMKKEIGDRAAITFAIGFYDALGYGRSLKDAYQFGCNAIDLSNIPESLTPVLRMREREIRSSQIINWLPEFILSSIHLSSKKNILLSAGLFAIMILWGAGCYAPGEPFLRLGLGIGLSYYFLNLKRTRFVQIRNLILAAAIAGLILGLSYSLWITPPSSGGTPLINSQATQCPKTESVVTSIILFVFWLVTNFFGIVTFLQFYK
ncbi:hypothetical protein WA1_06665 [Scytonema hofmannii PCC 7110]|uniref:CHAT domain-containing protein n=1 Tax=Scytonema hofmannii PCC 7110 TaxID=128403 RepID=A0A139WSW0_9CYAN|nr:CPP1-like family protein [Scytonema hofmannii]KYC35503.1 hypothetical protein WA1_06665 [Scytonema hofmannii PCC 7110]